MSGHTDKPSWAEILLDTSLTPTQRIVLLYLTWRQGGNGHAWPSQETIASDLSMTPEGVRRVILRLEEKGRLAVTRPKHTAPGVGYTYAVQHPTRVRVNTQPAVRVNTQPESLRHKGRTHTRTHTSKARAVSYTPAFERFWAEYPRKAGKVEAFREWQAIGPDEALAEKIIESVRAWKRSDQWAKESGKFIVYPVRFLKHRRFDDELPCTPEPRPGDPDWLPTEDEVDAVLAKVGVR